MTSCDRLSSVKLTKHEIEHIAQLARQGLTPAELSKFQMQLGGILDYVSQLNEVPTDGVSPTAQVTGLKNVMREDTVQNGVLADPDELLACSPLPIENRQIKVKSVF